MVDVHTQEQRSRNMAAIKSRNTKPELRLRKLLWNQGFRYRLKTKLPGKPDLVFSSVKLAIFIDGCFWHQCPEHFKMPATRAEFWREKISGNVHRDGQVNKALNEKGWAVLRFWEHEIRQDIEDVANRISLMHFQLSIMQ